MPHSTDDPAEVPGSTAVLGPPPRTAPAANATETVLPETPDPDASSTKTPPSDPPARVAPSAAVWRSVIAWLPAVTAILMVGYAVHAGLPALQAVRAVVVVLVTQLLPGVLVWRAVRPRAGWWLEDLAMGFAIGSVVAIGAQIVAGLAEQTWMSWTPVLVAVVLLAVPATRVRIVTARTRPLPWWFPASVAALVLVTVPQLRSYFRQVPLTWGSGRRTPHVDAYLHLSLVDQLAYRGPTTFPWVKSEALYYHWFSHAWVAQVGVASHDALDATLFRFMPVVVPVAVVLVVAMAAVRLSGRPWTGPVAAALAMAGGDYSLVGLQSASSPVFPLSPSLGLAIPMLVGIVVVLALSWRRLLLPGGLWLLPVLCIGASGTKGSTLPLIVAGLGVALVAMVAFNRSRIRRVVGDLIVVGGCLVFTLIVVFGASGEGLHFGPRDAADQTSVSSRLGLVHTVPQAALALGVPFLGVLARGAAGTALAFSRAGRRDPLTWLLLGGSLAGAGAIVALTHPGLSQWYFARTAEPLLALASALGLATLVEVIDPQRRVRVFALGAVGGLVLLVAGPALLGPLDKGAWTRAYATLAVSLLVILAAAAVGAALGRDRRQRLLLGGSAAIMAVLSAGVLVGVDALTNRPVAPLRPALVTAYNATSRDEIDAARWIRDHSGINDLVMTNRHCARPVLPHNCDNRRFVVTAFTERQVLLEGWTATPEAAKRGPNGRESITVDYWKPELLQLNDEFIASPTQAAADQLRRLGVKWIYVDHTMPYAPTLEPYATLVYHNAGVDVYEFGGS